MPRKKELPVPDSGEQDDLLSAETQEFPDAPLTEPVVEPIPTESPPDEGAPEDDTPSEEYTEFLQALNEAPAQEDPQPAPSDEAEPMPSEEEPVLTIPAEEPSSEAAPPESPPADSPPMPHNGAVLTITARTRIKSEAETTDELWHEIRNAYRTRRILTGTLDGIEQTAGGKTLATVSFRGFRIAIPIREMLVLEERMPSGRAYADYMNRLNRILGTMLGAEIDFIVKGIDSTTHSAVASRREAMLRKRQTFYLGKDVSGNPYIYPGRLVEARVIAVAEKVLRVEAFGIECAIFARDLSWQWVSDVRDLYSVGDRVLVRVQEISGEDAEHLSIRADIRSTFSETSVDNLKKCQVQSKYAGKVTDLRGGVVYIRLNNGVNAIAHTCYDSRMPGKKDDVSFAVTRLDEEHGVAVGIITRIIKRNL